MRNVGFPRILEKRRSRYEAQALFRREGHSILKEHEAAASAADLSPHHGVAENSIYRWKAKYSGMEESDAKGLRELEAENRKPKRLLGEAELDKAALQELVDGKW